MDPKLFQSSRMKTQPSGCLARRWAQRCTVFSVVASLSSPVFAQDTSVSADSAEAPVVAPADEPSPEQLAEARRLFAEGKAKMDEGAWAEAAQRFRAALEVKDTPGLRYHVAFCEENAERLLEALAQYQAARQLLESRPAPDVEELLGPALARLEERIPELRITLSRPAEPSLVAVNGRVVERWAVLRLDPGVHELRVVVPGHAPFVTELTLEPGARASLQVPLGEPQPPPREPTVVKTSSNWRIPVAVTGAAVSAAGLGLGVWGLFDRSAALEEIEWAQGGVSRLSSASSSCSTATDHLRAACDDLEIAIERRDRATKFAIGGFVAFGVGASVTVASLFFWPEQPVQVNAVTTGTHQGLQLTGRF